MEAMMIMVKDHFVWH